MTTIVEALQSLDHVDDEQWTAAGLPKVETVQELTQNNDLTRSDIDEVAPGFERFTDISDYIDAGESHEDEEQDEEIESEDDDAVNQWEEKKTGVEGKIKELELKKNEIDEKILVQIKKRDRYIEKILALRPEMTPTEAIKQYQESQLKNRLDAYNSKQGLLKQLTTTSASELDKSFINQS